MQGGGAQRAVLGSLSVPALVFPGSDAGFRHLGRLVRVSGFGSRAGGGAGQPRDCIRPRNWTRRFGMRTGRTLPRRRDEARGNPSTLAGAGHAEKRAAPRHAPPPHPTHTERHRQALTRERARGREVVRAVRRARAPRGSRRDARCRAARTRGSWAAPRRRRAAPPWWRSQAAANRRRAAPWRAAGGRARKGAPVWRFHVHFAGHQSRCAVRQLAAPARGAATTPPSGAAPLVRAAVGRYVPPGPPAALAPARAATPGAPHWKSARLHVGSLAQGRGAFGEKGCQRAALFALLGTKLAHRARVRTIKHRPER